MKRECVSQVFVSENHKALGKEKNAVIVWTVRYTKSDKKIRLKVIIFFLYFYMLIELIS